MLLDTPKEWLDDIEEEYSPDKLIGTGVKFERIRRITGYLVGTLDRFNDAKRKEVADRVKHVSSRNPALQ